MNTIEIRPVESGRQRRILLTFPWVVYGDDPCWVPPLLPERARVIDPDRGVFFDRGKAEFFIAYRDGKPAGTICAGVDPPINRARGEPACLFGFLEFLPDWEVFTALLAAAEEWGAARGLTSLYGPWNLDYEDSYGVLIDGWDQPPALMCGHSPPYYRDYLERAGFQPARPENVALRIDLRTRPEIDRLNRLAEKLRERSRFTVRSADFQRWDEEVDRVHRLLNRSLAHLEDHIGWRRDNLEAMLGPFREIADPDMILFAELEGETVGFLPGLPNLNEILIRVNGLRYPWDYLKAAWLSRSHRFESMTVKSVLVLPEYWNTGAAVLLFAELVERARARGYQWADLSITSLDNPSSVLTAEKLGARIYKRWQVYSREIQSASGRG
jgi:GNAT superfamily N-acetyltransferase